MNSMNNTSYMYNALRSLLSLLIVGFVLVPAAHAQNDITITLDEAIQIALVENIALDDYRRLYDSVGRDWHWVNRRHLTDRQLASLIHHPACHIRVLYRGNKPIGFVELNSRKLPEVEIVFVGLVSVEIGLGRGQANERTEWR